MSDISELKDAVHTKTGYLVFLTIVTGGIYLILWLNDSYRSIDRITETKTADHTYIIWVAVCSGLSGIFSDTGEDAIEMISTGLAIAYSVLCIIWAFRAKKALEDYCAREFKFTPKMLGFYTFIFNVFYINYCINDLPEAQRTQQLGMGVQTT